MQVLTQYRINPMPDVEVIEPNPMETPMRNTIKVMLLSAVMLSSASSVFAATRAMEQRLVKDPWFQQIHHESDAVSAKQFFAQTARDGH
jgi:hypothetical protein